MLHGLGSQVVEQVGVLVVGNIIEIHQAADDIVFQPRFVEAATAHCNHFQLIGAQVLYPEFVGNRRVPQGIQLQREGFEARFHLTPGHHQNARDVDGLLRDKLDRLCHHGRKVRLLRHPVQFQLIRLVLFLDRPDDGGLNFGLLQVLDAGQRLRLVFQLADDLVGDLRDFLLFPLGEGRRLILAGHRRAAGCVGRRQAQFGGQLRLRHHRGRFLPERIRIQHEGLQVDRRVRLVGLGDDLLKLVVGDDVQPIHGRHAGALAIGQTQAAPDGLLDEDAGIGRPQRHDGVEVGHVPALLEHVDVNHDLRRLVGVLHLE
ncbi:MAG: hypothetical protein AW09_000003 [Candidatus Accumulibacter phosphatis]|uniref:Uncharacterized protein n=1 Tax=Candidatus Accumulibacter phosphatis TaxID=327160 RepID=A0A080M088_9PROT|nr:MAG: hypothetical protein AW09_000003 [Candidatus Accumulibacter phosphatis]